MNDTEESQIKATSTLNGVNQLDSNLLNLIGLTKAINKANLLPQKETALSFQKINPNKFKSLQFNTESLLEELLDYQTKLSAKFNRSCPQTTECLNIMSNMIYCGQLFEKNKTEDVKSKFQKNYSIIERGLVNSRKEILTTYTPIIDFWYEKCRLNKMKVDKGPTEALKDIEASIDQLKKVYCTKPHNYKILGKRDSMESDHLFDPEVIEDNQLLEDGIRDLAEFTRRFKKNGVDGLVFENTEKYLASRRKKEKKVVDRRATKNRKLKYEVHEKIVNFMVPQDNELLLYNRDLIINQIFGQKKKETIIDKEKVNQDLDISLF